MVDLSLFAPAQFYKSGDADTESCAKLAHKTIAIILNGIEQEDIETIVFHMMIKNSQKLAKMLIMLKSQ